MGFFLALSKRFFISTQNSTVEDTVLTLIDLQLHFQSTDRSTVVTVSQFAFVNHIAISEIYTYFVLELYEFIFIVCPTGWFFLTLYFQQDKSFWERKVSLVICFLIVVVAVVMVQEYFRIRWKVPHNILYTHSGRGVITTPI